MAKFVGNYNDFVQTQIDRLTVLKRADSANATEYQKHIQLLFLKIQIILFKVTADLLGMIKLHGHKTESILLQENFLSWQCQATGEHIFLSESYQMGIMFLHVLKMEKMKMIIHLVQPY